MKGKEKLDDDSAILLVAPNKRYLHTVEHIVKHLQKTKKNICYVSLNRLSGPLMHLFHKKGIDTRKMFFIDGVTRCAMAEPPKKMNVCYIPAPQAVLDLNLAIADAAVTQKIDALVFDSPCTLLLYDKPQDVKKFVHFQAIKLKSLGIKTIFLCPSSDNEAARHLEKTVDDVVRLD